MAGGYAIERVQVVVIGGGQAGLSVGHYLSKRGRDVRHPRRQRAHRRRVAQALGLAASLLAGQVRRPGRDAVSRAGLQLSDQGRDGGLPRDRTRSTSSCRCGPASRSAVSRDDGSRYLVEAGDQRFEADQRRGRDGDVPEAARAGVRAELDPAIVQLHSQRIPEPGAAAAGRRAPRRRRQFRRGHRAWTWRGTHGTWLAGRHPGHVPFRIDSLVARADPAACSSAWSSIAC